jgi:hypothetical protein
MALHETRRASAGWGFQPASNCHPLSPGEYIGKRFKKATLRLVYGDSILDGARLAAPGYDRVYLGSIFSVPGATHCSNNLRARMDRALS